MVTSTATKTSAVQRYAWTVFVGLGAFAVLIGVGDFSSDAFDHTLRENGLNEVMIGLLALVIAAGGLRRGERWAWYAMSTWTVWLVAQGLLAFSSGRTDEGISAVVFLALALAALALSYPVSFGARR